MDLFINTWRPSVHADEDGPETCDLLTPDASQYDYAKAYKAIDIVLSALGGIVDITQSDYSDAISPCVVWDMPAREVVTLCGNPPKDA